MFSSFKSELILIVLFLQLWVLRWDSKKVLLSLVISFLVSMVIKLEKFTFWCFSGISGLVCLLALRNVSYVDYIIRSLISNVLYRADWIFVYNHLSWTFLMFVSEYLVDVCKLTCVNLCMFACLEYAVPGHTSRRPITVLILFILRRPPLQPLCRLFHSVWWVPVRLVLLS